MVQRLRAMDVLSEEKSSIPSTHVTGHNVCNSRPRRSNTLIWPLQSLYEHTWTCNHHTREINKQNLKKLLCMKLFLMM